MKTLIALASTVTLIAIPALAQDMRSSQATLSGNGVSGTVTVSETASGMVHMTIDVKGVPAGVHGFHVHEKGVCDADDGFKSAGGHLSGGMNHGIEDSEGPHAGDLPNLHAGEDGIVQVEYFTDGFSLDPDASPTISGPDGAPVILHAGADDYASQPSGAAGDRLACGVLYPPQ